MSDRAHEIVQENEDADQVAGLGQDFDQIIPQRVNTDPPGTDYGEDDRAGW